MNTPATAMAAMPADWPADIHLIGCGRKQPAPTHATEAVAQRVGSKAFGLLRMSELGLPVPPAFVLGTHYCSSAAMRLLAAQRATWGPGLQQVELATGKRFGDPHAPLLLAVRSGAPVSMPGMLGTLLNIGLCDATLAGLLRQTGNPRLVWDTYRRLVASYGELVGGISPQVFEAEYDALPGTPDEHGQLDFAQLRELTHRSLRAYERSAGQPFPQDPEAQLGGAIQAVLASWDSDKAREYRRQCHIDESVGTAVTAQSMVFGNGGGRSGAGVGFTRDPATGAPGMWVDFLFNAQGEDVVSGRRRAQGHEELARTMPSLWRTLCEFGARLERAFSDMQDFEFTVQDARLYLLQTRSGKRTPEAAVRIAFDLLDAGIIDAATVRQRTSEFDPATLVRKRVVFRDGTAPTPLAHAASACSGVATGEIALDAAAVDARRAAGASVILVRRDAETGDLSALQPASGLLTQRGAKTSHAAVIARQLGKVCLVGCEALRVDEAARTVTLGEATFHEGQVLTLDGNDGVIYAGEACTTDEPLTDLQMRLARVRLTGPAPA